MQGSADPDAKFKTSQLVRVDARLLHSQMQHRRKQRLAALWKTPYISSLFAISENEAEVAMTSAAAQRPRNAPPPQTERGDPEQHN